MTKKWSWGVPVDCPPMQGGKGAVTVSIPGATDPVLTGPGMPTEVVGALPGPPGYPARPEWDVDLTNGTVAVWPGVYRWVTSPNGSQTNRSPVAPGTSVRIEYDDTLGIHRTEVHAIGGWSQEVVVPIDTVVSEGPLRVAEETYTVSSTVGVLGPDMTWPVARRYWVFWTSPRPLYDLPTATNATGGIVRQSSDIYYCAVSPEYPQLVTARRSSTFAYDDFLP
jgi:hypothetical protein